MVSHKTLLHVWQDWEVKNVKEKEKSRCKALTTHIMNAYNIPTSERCYCIPVMKSVPEYYTSIQVDCLENKM